MEETLTPDEIEDLRDEISEAMAEQDYEDVEEDGLSDTGFSVRGSFHDDSGSCSHVLRFEMTDDGQVWELEMWWANGCGGKTVILEGPHHAKKKIDEVAP